MSSCKYDHHICAVFSSIIITLPNKYSLIIIVSDYIFFTDFAFNFRRYDLPEASKIDKQRIRKALQDKFSDIKRYLDCDKYGTPNGVM
jgi:hypothetical protein